MKRIYLETGRIGGQPEGRRSGSGLRDFEKPAARESIPRELMDCRPEAHTAPGARAGGQVGGKRGALVREIAGTQGYPPALRVRHVRALVSPNRRGFTALEHKA